jgi:hypothetical protein
VVVAVGPVRVMQMAADDIVDVVPVRDGLVTAVGAMCVGLRMFAAIVLRRAVRRVRGIHGKAVLVHMVAVDVVQVSVVEVIDMVAVLDRSMAAPRFVLMGVPFVHLAAALLRHWPASSPVGRNVALLLCPLPPSCPG